MSVSEIFAIILLTRRAVRYKLSCMENIKENEKIETQSKTYRLPVDVIGLLERWSEETGQTPTGVLTTVLRTAAEDEDRVIWIGGHRYLVSMYLTKYIAKKYTLDK